MKINPDLRIKATGIIFKAGGFFRFRVLKNTAEKTYQILSEGTRLTVKSQIKLYSDKLYEAQLKRRNNVLFLEKIHVIKPEKQNSPKNELPESKEPLVTIDMPHESYNSLLHNRYELVDEAVINDSAKELCLLEPLIILFKKKEYKGTLSLILKKKSGAKIFTLNLEKGDLIWRFNLNSLDGNLSIRSFCNKVLQQESRQDQWIQLCTKWKSIGIEADKSIKLLRSPTTKAENNRVDVSRIIDIEV